MLPGGAAVGGLVDAVERGAQQHAGGVVGRQCHAGEVGVRMKLSGGDPLPRHAAVAAQVHGRRGGGGQPARIGGVGSQGRDGGYSGGSGNGYTMRCGRPVLRACQVCPWSNDTNTPRGGCARSGTRRLPGSARTPVSRPRPPAPEQTPARPPRPPATTPAAARRCRGAACRRHRRGAPPGGRSRGVQRLIRAPAPAGTRSAGREPALGTVQSAGLVRRRRRCAGER